MGWLPDNKQNQNQVIGEGVHCDGEHQERKLISKTFYSTLCVFQNFLMIEFPADNNRIFSTEKKAHLK